MLSQVRRALAIGNAALILSGFGALAITDQFGIGILIVPLVLFAYAPIGARLDERHPRYRRITWALTLLFTVCLPGIFVYRGLFVGVMMLIMFILAHKLAHRMALRDYYHTVLMSFFLLLAACSRNPDAEIAPILIAFLLSGVWTMLMLSTARELEAVGGGTQLAHIVRIGDRRTAVDWRPPSLLRSSLLTWGGAAAAACLGFTVFLFLLTPRMELGLTTSVAVETSVTGISEGVNLMMGGPIAPDNTVAMRVTFPDEPNGRYHGQMYWRAGALDWYARSVWGRSGRSARPYDGSPRPEFFAYEDGVLARSETPGLRKVHQRITLEKMGTDQLPCLPLAQRVVTDDVRLAWATEADCSVVATSSRDALEYEVWSEIYEARPEELRQAPDTYRWYFAGDLGRLTWHQLSPAAMQLARELTVDADTVYDRVIALRDWLSSSEFLYTLDVPEPESRRPVDEFLLRTRRGHCELFASSLALMARSLGIPARVVSGYRGGVWSEPDQAYLVTNSMAHLWVEVYFIGHGWIPFDPSPADDGATVGDSALSRLYLLSLRAKILWYRYVMGYSGGVSMSMLQDLSMGRLSLPVLEERSEGLRGLAPSRRALALGAALAGGVLVGVALFLRRPGAKATRAYTLTRDQRRAARLVRAMKRRLDRRGVDCRGMTAGEILAAVRAHAELDAETAARFIEAYNRIRFGGDPLTPDQRAAMREAVRAL